MYLFAWRMWWTLMSINNFFHKSQSPASLLACSRSHLTNQNCKCSRFLRVTKFPSHAELLPAPNLPASGYTKGLANSSLFHKAFFTKTPKTSITKTSLPVGWLHRTFKIPPRENAKACRSSINLLRDKWLINARELGAREEEEQGGNRVLKVIGWISSR